MSGHKKKIEKEWKNFLGYMTNEAFLKISKEKSLKGKFYQLGQSLIRLLKGHLVYRNKLNRPEL